MKYLQDYMNEKQTKALEKAGAFFAFSNAQFDEEKKDGVKYANCGGGMIAESDKVDVLLEELNTIYKDSIKEDIEENGLESIVKRELNNHEAYYTQDLESTCKSLADYPVTKEIISKIFRNKNYTIEQEITS